MQTLARGLMQLLSKTMPGVYARDALITVHNHDFVFDPQFAKAYKRGIKANGYDYHIEWRVHVALWAASYARKLVGDFVECGVNTGFLSSAIMQYLDWNSLNKTFYLLDTFHGLDETQLNAEEIAQDTIKQYRSFYNECYENVRRNFAAFKHVKIIRGVIPFTLKQVSTSSISYLSIDLNCANPEIAAIEYFWPKLVPGGIVLLDDYAYSGHLPQKRAFDQFATQVDVKILSLPTGQGMFVKPPSKR